MNLRPTLAVGYDAAVAVDPSIYDVTEDARGRAFAFDMDSSRDAVEDTVRSAFGHSKDLELVDVTPGYVRVRLAPMDPMEPKAVLDTLRSTAGEYNARHATDPDLDGLAFDTPEYIGTYTPEDALDHAAFLDRHAPTDVSPESDGPVFTYTRDDAGEDALRSDRRLRYRVTLPFDGKMYEQKRSVTGDGTPPVRWEPDAVKKALRVTVEDLPPWPGRSANTPQVTVTPDALVVEHVTASLTDDPARLAEQIRHAFGRYNRYRNVDAEHSTQLETQLHPPIKFAGTAYIRALDADRDAEDWADALELDAVDGSPITEDADDDPEDTEDADTGRSLNPFR